MSTDTDTVEDIAIEMQLQSQPEPLLRQEGVAYTARPIPVDGEPLIDRGDISLAMRQFYQSPVRSLG